MRTGKELVARIGWLMTLFLILSSRVGAREYTFTFHQEIPVKSGYIFELVEPTGDIIIEGFSGTVIEIDGRKTVEASSQRIANKWARQVNIEIEQLDNRISVRTRYPKNRGRNNIFDWLFRVEGYPRGTVDYAVKMPPGGSLIVTTTSGDCRITKVDGKVDFRGTSGDVNIKQLKGDLDLTITSGDVTVQEIAGTVAIDGTSSDIFVQHINGPIKIESVSGELRIITGRGLLNVNSTSGDVRLTNQEGDLEITTVSGDIEVRNLRGALKLSTTSGDINARVNELTGERSSIKTISGQVHLSLPDETNLWLAINTQSGEVEVRLPLRLRSISRHRLEGEMGTAANRMTIESLSGNILVTGLEEKRAGFYNRVSK